MISLKKAVLDSCKAKKNLLKKNSNTNISEAIKKIYTAIKNGNKILVCGNGGSSSDASHMVAELLIRLRPAVNRKSIPAIALTMDISTLTACGNYYGFKNIFSRPFEALATKGDILIAITTSGNSANIDNVLKESKKKKIYSISLLGKYTGKCNKLSNLEVKVNSKNTARIQETHIFIIHYILESVEDLLINNGYC